MNHVCNIYKMFIKKKISDSWCCEGGWVKEIAAYLGQLVVVKEKEKQVVFWEDLHSEPYLA